MQFRHTHQIHMTGSSKTFFVSRFLCGLMITLRIVAASLQLGDLFFKILSDVDRFANCRFLGEEHLPVEYFIFLLNKKLLTASTVTAIAEHNVSSAHTSPQPIQQNHFHSFS